MMNKGYNKKFFDKSCFPCESNENLISKKQAEVFLSELHEWRLNENAKMIFREYTMKNFISAVEFIQMVANIAEGEGHHPNVYLTNYKNLKIEFTTHAIGGLSENDFIMAAKIDNLSI